MSRYSEFRVQQCECPRLPRLYLRVADDKAERALPVGTSWTCPNCSLVWIVARINSGGQYTPETKWLTAGTKAPDA